MTFSAIFFVGYIDPNAGGWLFQLLFPVFIASGGLWIVFQEWVARRWRTLLRRDGKKEDK